MQYKKIFVEVISKFDLDGNIIPMSILWEDGRKFDIDKILDVRKAASLKAGGKGNRYTILISGQQRYLFDDCGRWFVEGIV